MLRKRWIVASRRWWNSSSAVRADQARSKFDAMYQVFFKKFEDSHPSAQMSGKGGGRRNSEDEQEQGKAS